MAVVVSGSGCVRGPEQTLAKPDCGLSAIYDWQTRACVRPESPEQARRLVGRDNLETLRAKDDIITTVQIHLLAPGDRAEFESILSRTNPASVTNIGYYFPDVGGGFNVPVKVDDLSTSTAELISVSSARVSDRFTERANPELNAFAPQFVKAFSDAKEMYLEIHMRAKPSDLLSAWAQDSNIDYISIVVPDAP